MRDIKRVVPFTQTPTKQLQMARILPHSLLLLLPLLLLLLFASCKTLSADNNHHQKLKSLHFTLYQQETVNKTIYLIVNGVAGVGISQTTTPFGTIAAFRDPLTATVDSSSPVVGLAEGIAVTTSLDGLWSLAAGKVTVDMKQHKGTISLLGGTHNTRAADTPVVGGTGDFLFVQGYVRVSPVDLKGLHVIYKLEFHLYWPPYASQAAH